MQRVALASILVRNPSILLLDESTSMLDPLSKIEMISMLKDLKKKFPNLTILSVTHETAEIEKADYVIALDHEKLGFTGSPNEYQLRNDLSELGIETSKFDNPEELGRQLCQHSK